MRHRLICH